MNFDHYTVHVCNTQTVDICDDMKEKHKCIQKLAKRRDDEIHNTQSCNIPLGNVFGHRIDS